MEAIMNEIRKDSIYVADKFDKLQSAAKTEKVYSFKRRPKIVKNKEKIGRLTQVSKKCLQL